MKPSDYNKIVELYKQATAGFGFEVGRQEAVKQQILKRLNESSADEKFWPVMGWRPAYVGGSLALVLVLLTGGGVVAAQSSLPGDKLYSVKKIVEKIELSIPAPEQTVAQVKAKHASVRLEELAQLEAKQDVLVEHDSTLETRDEVENALNVLSEVGDKLEAKGNTQAASAVRDTFEKLSQRATRTKFKIDRESSGKRILVKIKNRDESDDDEVDQTDKLDDELTNNPPSPAVRGEQDSSTEKSAESESKKNRQDRD